MAQGQRKYEKEYKVQAVKLAKEIGAGKAAKELGIPADTVYGWQKAVREGRLDAGPGSRGPVEAMSLAEELGDAAQADQGAGAGEPAAEGRERVFSGGQRFFRREPSEVSREHRMRFVAQKTDGGGKKGKIALYCRVLKVSRQGFYRHLSRRERPWKYQRLADAMREIHDEDVCNDTCGRKRMHQALLLKQPEGVDIPSERTIYRVMKEIGLVHHPRRRPNVITRAYWEARKSDDLLKRDFSAEKSLEKCVTDITERKAKDGRLYVSAIFDCFDLTVLGLAMDDNTRAELCVRTLDSAAASYPALRGAIVHSDRGSQYTSGAYRAALEKHGIRQSMK